MVLIFFIYGLAFFSLGLSILIYPKEGSRFGFARDFYLVGLFGILHGIKEWLDMFGLLPDYAGMPLLSFAKDAFLPISFIPLLLFGSRHIFEGRPALKAIVPATLSALWLVAVSSGGGGHSFDIWSRYLLAAPGIIMTAFSLPILLRREKNSGLHRISSHMRLSTIGFFLYGVFAGLIVPEGEFFPASLLNYGLVTDVAGIPVQVFRALSAMLITYGMVRALSVFDWEAKDVLLRAKDGLELRVEERTVALKTAYERILSSERKLRDITSALGEGVYVVDNEGRTTFMNPEAERLFGWREDEVLGKNLHEIVHCEKAKSECPVLNVIKSGKPVRVSEDFFRRRDGSVLPVSFVSKPLMADGKLIGSVTVFSDITERKTAENERLNLISELQKALSEVKTLSGMLPICAWCKNVRDDKGYWKQVESYLSERSDLDFTHGICPECYKKVSGEEPPEEDSHQS